MLTTTVRFLGLALLIFMFAGSPAAAAEFSGVVLDIDTLQPIQDALVTLQATDIRTTTAADGSFTLDFPEQMQVVVAARKGYFNGSVFDQPPASGVQILLEPVPQENDPAYDFLEPTTCAICHQNQLEEWTGSPMAKAGSNTWVDDIYSGYGTPGGMGGFVYLRDSVFAESNPNSECASCHQPELWIETPFSALEDPMVPDSPEVAHGISCEVCHKIADVSVEQINYPGIFPGAVTFSRPADSFENQVLYGVLGDVDFNTPGFMRASYQPQLEAEVCGVCHQDKNDPDEDHSFTGITSEPTYIEWIESPYGDPESPFYATCVDCHMQPSSETEMCSVFPLPREPGTIRDHDIRGTTPQYLENAAEMTMTAAQVGDRLEVEIDVANTLTGHHVPTGVTVRNMILLVEAWRDGDDPLTDSLADDGSQTIHDLGGIGDPAQGYYAGLPGKFYAKHNQDANGNGPTFFTDAVGIVFDNRIPALETDTTNYSFELPTAAGVIRVRARLIYRRAFRFLVDAKNWTEDGHGNPLEDVAEPHFGHLMESAEQMVSTLPAGGVCGDGTLNPGEECDDGNLAPGDGCDPRCQLEPLPIPTVSEWGLLVMTLLLLVGGRFLFRQR